jgi:hypothetical protein
VGAHKCLADNSFTMESRRMDMYRLYSKGDKIEPIGKHYRNAIKNFIAVKLSYG